MGFFYFPSSTIIATMVEKLGQLFGSEAKVKIMRLFLLNQTQPFDVADISLRARVTQASCRSEMRDLVKAGFVKQKNYVKHTEVMRKRGRKKVAVHVAKKTGGWIFDEGFEYREALQNLLLDTEFLTPNDLAKRFKRAGKIKLLLAAGVFRKEEDSRLDILLVGDNLKRGVVEKTIRVLEAEIGKELAYAVFETPEFLYRANMYDKLIRDVIDFPHDQIIDQGVLSQVPKNTA
jgi:hypothetical protein